MNTDELDAARALNRFHGWVRAVQQFHAAGDLAAVEDGTSYLFRMASALLLAHARGYAELPADVAMWLHRQLERALQGDAALVLHGGVRNLRARIDETAASFAAGYIAHGPGGGASGAKSRRVRQVADAYGVSERTAFLWKEDRPAFAAAMAKLPPGQDLDAWALEVLRELATYYRSNSQPLLQ